MTLFSVAFWLFLFNSLLTMCFIFSSEPLLIPPPPPKKLIRSFLLCLHSSLLSISFLLYFNSSYGLFIETTENDFFFYPLFWPWIVGFKLALPVFSYQNIHIFICIMYMRSPPYVGVAFKITWQIVA